MAWILSGLATWVPSDADLYIVGSVALGVVLRDLRILEIGLPERRQLVPSSILQQAPHRAALGFGFELGLGFRTALTGSAPYLLVVALVLSAEGLALYLGAGAAFGLGRFAMAAGRYFGPETLPSRDRWSGLLDARSSVVRASAAVVAALGAIALTAA